MAVLPALYAHRLGRAYGPDSSGAALTRALQWPLDGIETDCCLTADGELVLLHDPLLEVGTTGSGWAHERTAAEIRAGRLRHPDGTPSNERPLLLDELLELAPPGVTLQLEVKAHADPALARDTARALCDRLRDHPARERTEVISFWSGACELAAELGFRARLVVIAGPDHTECAARAHGRAGSREGFPERHPGSGGGVSLRVTIATAQRVLWQIRRDPRTIALLLVVPCLLLVLMRYVFDGREQTFQHIGAPLCGLFPFIIMFLITSITMLRERTTGTLERLMTLPLAKLDLLVGYGIAFGVLAAAQAVAVCLVGFVALGLESPHGALLIGALAVGNALLGMALGLFVSAFARTEFQAVQFIAGLHPSPAALVRPVRGA